MVQQRYLQSCYYIDKLSLINSVFGSCHALTDNHEPSPRKRKSEFTSQQEGNRSQFDGDDDDDDDVPTEENGESSCSNEPAPKKKKRKEFLNLNATFMAGVPGVTLFTEQVSSILFCNFKWE